MRNTAPCPRIGGDTQTYRGVATANWLTFANQPMCAEGPALLPFALSPGRGRGYS